MARLVKEPVVAVLALLAAGLVGLPARAEENDLREFRIGMHAAELPRSGYVGLACAVAPDRKLGDWQEFRRCDAEADGSRPVRFRYDEAANPLAGANALYEGTKVGGHPVLLTLSIDDAAEVVGLVIETDPAARLYMRKKAFLFGDQVKARYGEDGWQCASLPASGDEQPVGGVFIHEHCVKHADKRDLTLDRSLFRHGGQALKDFVSASRLEIRKAR